MTCIRLLGAAMALLVAIAAHAELILSMPDGTTAASGAPLRLELTILNSAEEPLRIELPTLVHVRFEAAQSVSTLDFVPERSGAIEIAPRQFLRIALNGAMPESADDIATLALTGMNANRLTVQIAHNSSRPTGTWAASETTPRSRPQGTALIDKPPPLAVSVYEPVYFIVGGDDGLNAKFQISLRFRLFDDRGRLARRLPWIDDLYLSFSQTALWDLGELSKPFTDVSYRPRLFYANYDLARYFDGRVRVGVETGVGHESNGKVGDASRSFNMLYARPTITLGDPDGLRMYAAPLIHNYIADGENRDLEDYRGYVDWLFGVGSKGGLDVWGIARKGARSDYGSFELNASYPLSKLSGGDLTGWLMLQYFAGYGESLLEYRRKLDSQLRLGISVAL